MDIIITTEERLRSIIQECLIKAPPITEDTTKPSIEKEFVKSIADIAEMFSCSTVTAQRIKNQIPKNSYFQCGRTFSISKSFLLEEFPKIKKGRKLNG